MYPATAGIGSSLRKLQQFPDYRKNQLLILAGLELTIAYSLSEAQWKIYNSIFWKRSNAATKFSVLAKLEGVAFDVDTSIISAGKLLNQYYERHGVNQHDRECWIEIIHQLQNAQRWLTEQCGVECVTKQLKLDL